MNLSLEAYLYKFLMHIIIMNIPKHFVDILPFQYKVFYRSVVRMDRSLVWFPNWKPENVCQQYIYIYYAKYVVKFICQLCALCVDWHANYVCVGALRLELECGYRFRETL